MIWVLVAWMGVAAAEEPPVDIALGDALAAPKKAIWEPKGKALDLFLAADIHYRSKEWVRAARGFIDVLAEQPGCGKAAFRLSFALSEKDEHDDAATVIEQVVLWFPDDRDALVRAVTIHLRGDQPEKAASKAEVLQTRWPTDLRGWHFGLRTAQQTGSQKDATALLERARAHVEEASDIACLTVMAAAATGDEITSEAEWPTCKQSESADLRKLAEANRALVNGDWLTAQKYADTLDDKPLLRLTQVLQRLEEGNAKGALLITDKLIADAPSEVDVRVARARAQFGAGAADAAAATLDALFAQGWQTEWAKGRVLHWAGGPEWLGKQWEAAAVLRADAWTALGKADAASAWLKEAAAVWPAVVAGP